MEDMIRAAIRAGLDSICFTEHVDPDFPPTEEPFDFMIDFDAYEAEFQRLYGIYGDQIRLFHGIELGIQPHLKDTCAGLYDRYGARYDYIIHSTHVVDRLDPYYGAYFASYRDPKEAVKHYFRIMLRNLQVFRDYQSVGHLDYICRYEPAPRTPFLYEDYKDVIDPVLIHIIEQDKCLEVNTAGWKYGMEDPNPNRQILLRYRQLGGNKITIGSDGHKPDQLAYDYHRLPGFLKDLGFDSYLFFEKKKAREIPL